MKARIKLDWFPVNAPTGTAWRCEALGCVFAAFPAFGGDGWRLTCFDKAVPGSTRAVGEDGELMPDFKGAPIWATKEDAFAAAKKFIAVQAGKLDKRGKRA